MSISIYYKGEWKEEPSKKILKTNKMRLSHFFRNETKPRRDMNQTFRLDRDESESLSVCFLQ